LKKLFFQEQFCCICKEKHWYIETGQLCSASDEIAFSDLKSENIYFWILNPEELNGMYLRITNPQEQTGTRLEPCAIT
jgi:hypothetical protein